MTADRARRVVAVSYNLAVLQIVVMAGYVAWTGSTRALAGLIFAVWLTLTIQGALLLSRRSGQ